ncbi:hypothetical protein B0H19DRAFT_188467 [Mycena capillaripes]|nr:hypothetical protein B0H19DRAFT_188467 [Mycena capillaripes]
MPGSRPAARPVGAGVNGRKKVAATPPVAGDASSAPIARPSSPPTPVMPGSRPAARPVGAGVNGRKKVVEANADKKEVSAAAARKAAVVQDVVKKRGRPRKVLTDVANAADESAAEVDTSDTPTATTAAPAAPTAPAAPAAPEYVYTMTNNNRRGAKRAADAEKAAKEKEVAEAKAKQAAKGWIEATQHGTSTVILTHARKPKTFADGTVAQRQVKARANPHSATEAVLPARMEKGDNGKGSKGKRKADAEPQAAVSTRKRRKV